MRIPMDQKRWDCPDHRNDRHCCPGVLAGGFSYSMKVETRLAQNGSFDSEPEWIGRSGVEVARTSSRIVSIFRMNRGFAKSEVGRGPKGTNQALEGISLDYNRTRKSTFSVKITDMERS
jgi:hypothetical protein